MRRQGEFVSDVREAQSEERGVHGQNEGLEAGVFCSLDQIPGDFAESGGSKVVNGTDWYGKNLPIVVYV